ncbi:hypothetical protein Trydic_g5579 [Trypoxylus dichotomus]
MLVILTKCSENDIAELEEKYTAQKMRFFDEVEYGATSYSDMVRVSELICRTVYGGRNRQGDEF